MSAGTDIKTAEQRFDDLTADGWQGMNIAKVRDRLKDEERAELRAALEAAEQKLAHYALAEKAVESSLVNAGLDNQEWADRFFATVQPDSERDAALVQVIATGYEGGTMVDEDLGGTITLHYQSPAEAENAFEALTEAINAAMAAQCDQTKESGNG